MKEKRNYFDKLALRAELPTESAPGQPLVEIAGEARVLIENHCGVTAYGCDRIHVKVSYGQLCVCGSNLKLAYMTKHQLVITGKIDAVSLLRGRK